MQAVALVFEHVGSAHEAQPGGADGEVAEPANGGVGEEEGEGIQRKGSLVLAQQGAANAALKLLDDLCMMATGDQPSQLTWEPPPPLPGAGTADLSSIYLQTTERLRCADGGGGQLQKGKRCSCARQTAANLAPTMLDDLRTMALSNRKR